MENNWEENDSSWQKFFVIVICFFVAIVICPFSSSASLLAMKREVNLLAQKLKASNLHIYTHAREICWSWSFSVIPEFILFRKSSRRKGIIDEVMFGIESADLLPSWKCNLSLSLSLAQWGCFQFARSEVMTWNRKWN